MSGQTKLCSECGKAFARPADYSARQWADRKTCSRSCSHLARMRGIQAAKEIAAQPSAQARAVEAIWQAMNGWRVS